MNTCNGIHFFFQSPNEGCQTVVQEIRKKFTNLIKKPDNVILSQGEMLLIAFHGLFEDVSLANENVIKMTSKLKVSTAWKTVDQIREAKSLLVSSVNIYCERK